MTQQPLFAPPAYDVKPGDIYALGRHRLMCADATDKAEVARLFAGDRPTMVVTSPPYAKQRDYDRPIACWDSMMMGALDGHVYADDVQLLVNLGVIHLANECFFYWTRWVALMREKHWRLYSQYVWHKMMPSPGYFHGRLAPSHEFIFHWNKKTAEANKCLTSKHPGHMRAGRNDIANKAGVRKPRKKVAGHGFKTHESVIQSLPVLVHESVGHPAQMPKALAMALIASWKKVLCVVYDPFSGSATTLHAAEAEGVLGLGCEISPAYVAIALARWNKAHPDTPAQKIASAP